MSLGSSTTGRQRTITAFFDRREDANEALERLISMGIARTDARIVEGAQGGSGTTGSMASGTQGTVSTSSYPQGQGSGFWEALTDLFLPDQDRHTYAEGLRRGGYLLTVRATDAQFERVVDILDDEGTVDMDQRETSWRSEGWTGYDAGSAGRTATSGLGTSGSGTGGGLGTTGSTTGLGTTGSATGLGATGSATGGLGATGSTSGGLGTTATGATGTARTSTGDETIQLAEEQLRVGKRQVNEGRVRVRSYVVETPVEEQVNLRQEHAIIERRPVDQTATTTGANLFQDRTVEMTETAEEAVVAKDARVKEELVIHKGVENRTETVRDTVRRTEVEVEDDRATRNTGTTGTTTDRNR